MTRDAFNPERWRFHAEHQFWTCFGSSGTFTAKAAGDEHCTIAVQVPIPRNDDSGMPDFVDYNLGEYARTQADLVVDTYAAHYPRIGFWQADDAGTRLRHDAVTGTYMAERDEAAYLVWHYAADGARTQLRGKVDRKALTATIIGHYMRAAVEVAAEAVRARNAVQRSASLIGRKWVTWDGKIGRVEAYHSTFAGPDKPNLRLQWLGRSGSSRFVQSDPFFNERDLLERYPGFWMPGTTSTFDLISKLLKQVQRVTVLQSGDKPEWIRDFTMPSSFD
jgi:hypothetical protein